MGLPLTTTLMQVTLETRGTSLCPAMQEGKPTQIPASENFMGFSKTILAWRNILKAQTHHPHVP